MGVGGDRDLPGMAGLAPPVQQQVGEQERRQMVDCPLWGQFGLADDTVITARSKCTPTDGQPRRPPVTPISLKSP